MRLSERLRLKHYAAPKPYQFQVGPVTYRYDPATGHREEVSRVPLAPPNRFEYEGDILHIRPAGDLKPEPTHK